MNRPGPDIRTALRYALFQIPGVALVGAILLILARISLLPPWAAWCVFSLWILKDLALFPFLWRSYSTSPAGMMNTMIGQEGKAREALRPKGRIVVHGVLWHAEMAEGCPGVERDDDVVVREIRGLTLVVEPAVGGTPGTPPGP